MKLANYGGRAALVLDGSIADVHDASGGRFGPDPMSLYQDWPAFADFAAGISAGTAPLDESRLGCPVPAPRQVFAIGLNYRSHAEESGMAVPSVPATFTKFPASLSGPFDDIEIVGDTVDWEVELVAVIGTRADRVDEADSLVSRRRPHRRAGHQRPHAPIRRRLAVLAREIAPRLRADGSMARHARRGARPRRPRARVLGRRRDGAGRTHLRPHLRRPSPDRRTLWRLAAAPRRCALHRHPGRRRRHPAATAVLATGPAPRDLDRGDRYDPQPVRDAFVNVPRHAADLFCDDMLDDRYAHLQALRDAGPLVWLEAHRIPPGPAHPSGSLLHASLPPGPRSASSRNSSGTRSAAERATVA